MAGVGEVSAIVSLATFGVAVAKNIILYSRKVKGAPNELEAIADEVHSASRLLQDFALLLAGFADGTADADVIAANANTVNNLDIQPVDAPTDARRTLSRHAQLSLQRSQDSCRTVFTKLWRCLLKACNMSEDTPWHSDAILRFHGLARSTWPLKESEMHKDLQRLGRLNQNLFASASILHLIFNMLMTGESSVNAEQGANIGGAAVSHQQLHAAIALLGPDLEPTKFAYATEEGETTNREAEPKGFCSALGSCLFCLLCPWCWASRSQHPNHRSSGNVVREIEHELQYVTARGLDHFEHHGPVVKSVESELKEIEMELGASASRRIKTLAKNMSGAKLNDKKATRKAQDLIDEWSKGEAWLV